MTLAEMRQRAEADPDYCVLVTPEGFRPPQGFPRGELLCENTDGQRVRRYDSSKILAWVSMAERMLEDE